MESLSRTLKVTRTAITNHLARLQAEGLVHRHRLRPGPRRPSIVYELTATADRLFPKAYDEFAVALLEEIKRERPEDLKRYLQRIADRWIARDLPRLQGFHDYARLEQATHVLAKRGFMPVLEQTSDGYLLREHNCPLMQLTVAHPEICDLVHQWLEALFDARLSRAQCLRQGDPSSTYVIESVRGGSRGSQ